MIKAVIFDMDGVILDSETICARTWKEAGKEYKIAEEKSIELQTACLGTNKNDTCLIIKNILGNDFPSEKFLERTSQLFHDIEFSEGIPLMPYARETLEKLHGRYRIALASSTRGETVKRQLKAVNVIDFFETLTTGDMVNHSKPDPEIYRIACASLGLKPEECIAVEDSPNGIKSAYAAGLKTVMIPDKIQPDTTTASLCWKICQSLKEFERTL